MELDVLREHILKCLTRAAERDAEKGGSGCRTARDVSEWIGIDILGPDDRRAVGKVRRVLLKMEEDGLVENVGKIPGLGNAVFWNLRVPVQKNTLVVIGYMGIKRAYLNMSEEDALQAHLESEWSEGWDEAIEAETRERMTSFEFTDRFSVYDASSP